MKLLDIALAGLSLVASATAVPASSAGQTVNGQAYPPSDWQKPRGSGISSSQNSSIQPWNHLEVLSGSGAAAHVFERASCPSLTPSNPSQYWYGQIDHSKAKSPFLNNADAYTVWRNVVTDFGADPSGKSDSTSAFRKAINRGGSGMAARTSGDTYGETMKPAVVYIPPGTYLLSSELQLYCGTVIVGDALNPPVLKVSSGFSGDHLFNGRDPNWGSATQVFYIGMKNLIIDSTAYNKDADFTLVYWALSQATQLQNVVFNMPINSYSKGHKGISMGSKDYNSNIIINDLTFNGGYQGMDLNGQQWVFKGMTFNQCTTGVNIGSCADCVFVGASFRSVGTGISAYGVSGSLVVLDSSIANSGPLIKGTNGYQGYQSIILENIASDDESKVTVDLDQNHSAVKGSIPNTWVLGYSYYSGDANQHRVNNGERLQTARSQALLDGNNKYVIKKSPSFQEYSVDQVVNIKSVSQYPVRGDGNTDDTANINAILSQYAGCKVIYFPAGTYIVTDTILIPPGSRIHGDAYGSVISATGANFYKPNSPRAMVKVGNAGDVGVAQIVDMMFSVADVLQGCKLLEINMAGNQPGDVGLWNSHLRVGGAAGSKVQDNCYGSPASCKAAWGMVHLTKTSSAYIENMWAWTADHNLDKGGGPTISTGRGILVEATKGTWLVGTGSEHNTLYQYDFNNAQNVFTAMQQTETPYWQGPQEDTVAPSPWSNNLDDTDPTFANCAGDDKACRMAFMQRISGSSNLFLYGGCLWAFYDGQGNIPSDQDVQQNAVIIASGSKSVYMYGTNVHHVSNIVRSNGKVIATQGDNKGGWGGVVAAYLYNA